MPELPEVETVRRGLQPVMEGALITRVEARRPDLRFPLPENFAGRLTGATVRHVGRRAKYLLLETDRAPVLISHLGMSGSWRIEAEGGANDGSVGSQPGAFHHPRAEAGAHDHIVFHLQDGAGRRSRITYNDPRRFGFMLFCNENGRHPMLERLGVEPVGNALSGPVLTNMVQGRSTTLKATLLDQSLIAGLGNIYVSEALWRARLSPRRSAGSIAGKGEVSTKRGEALASAIRGVIADAIAAGGSTLRDFVHADGALGYFQHSFSVYDREGQPCLRPGCPGTINRIVQNGRSTYYCPACQR